MSAERLIYLDSLRGVAMMMVVGVHTYGYVDFAPADPKALIIFTISTIAVPVFFLVDGFLFAYKQAAGHVLKYREYLLKSARRLMLPWLIFSLLYTFLRAIFESTDFLTEKTVIMGTPKQIILYIYTSSIAPQMYFLLSLFLIRTLSVYTRYLVLWPAWAAMAIWGSYTFFYRNYFHDIYDLLIVLPGLDPVLHAFWGMQYYLFGMVLFKLKDHIMQFSPLIALSAFAFVVAVKSSVVAFKFTIMPELFSLQYAYLIWAFCFFIVITKHKNILTEIGTHTMGIYLLHAPVLLKGLQIIVMSMIENKWAVFILVWIGTFACAWILTKIISQIPYANFIFGDTTKKKVVFRWSATIHPNFK
jgi:surface polysaccharide O-acyltransferase-like enzyme